MLVCGTAVRCKGLRGGQRLVLWDNSIKPFWSEKNIERCIKKDELLLAHIKDSEMRETSKRTMETSVFPLMKTSP